MLLRRPLSYLCALLAFGCDGRTIARDGGAPADALPPVMFLCTMLAFGCDGGMATPDAGAPVDANPAPPTLETDAVVTFAEVYQSTSIAGRDWIPMDLSVSPDGTLWVVQRIPQLDRFDDETECTSAAQSGAPNDCAGLAGSTVTITDPAAGEPATADNDRAKLISDYNAWHFMRRPAGIAFGAPELTIEPGDPGAADPNNPAESLLTEPLVLTNTFATCHEHFTGNFTDAPPFIGPTLWTSDPDIYDGGNGSDAWSVEGQTNGSHLDMVHATQYCVGIAYDSGAIYWVFNGNLGTIDRYDFGVPHVPGHHNHEDGEVTRYVFEDALVRVPNVPSNLEVSGDALFIADTGNGRVVRLDRTADGTVSDTAAAPDVLVDIVEDVDLTEVIGEEALSAEWGDAVEPSGVAMLDEDTMVVASHASGHLTLLTTEGEVLRTIDTGTGAGLGGVAVLDGVIYFTQMNERRVYRVDVDESMRAGE